MTTLATRAALLAATLAALACGPAADTPDAGDSSAAAAPAPPAGPATPTLSVGGRYETQAGAVVCPRPDALNRLLEVAQRGDTAAFVTALGEGGCSPVVAGAIVHVAEQREAAARVRRAGDTATYWMLADKLTPR